MNLNLIVSGRNTLSFFSILAILLASCNKNSNELPYIEAPLLQMTQTYYHDGIPTLRFRFEQWKSSRHDTVWVSVENLTDKPISGLTVMLELCKATPLHYDNCTDIRSRTLSAPLAPGQTEKNVWQFADMGLKLDSGLIHTGVISWDGLQHPMGGIYTLSNESYALYDTATFAFIRGYILADGRSVFRTKAGTEDYRNAYGTFNRNLSYLGSLQSGAGALIAPLQADSVRWQTSAGADTAALFLVSDSLLRFRLKPAASSGFSAALNAYLFR